MSHRFLIVGLTPALLSAAQAALIAEGSDAEQVDARADLEIELESFAPDLIIVEGGLKNPSTPELLRLFKGSRHHASLPIIVYGGELSELERIVAFELGADDVLSEPISERELVLRASAILKRIRIASRPKSEAIEIGGLLIDRGGARAQLDGSPLALTALEARLLYELARARDRAKSRDDLIRHVWNGRYPSDSRTLDTHIRRLRRKLGGSGEAIETLRGVGYRLNSAPLIESGFAFHPGRDGST